MSLMLVLQRATTQPHQILRLTPFKLNNYIVIVKMIFYNGPIGIFSKQAKADDRALQAGGRAHLRS